MCILERNVENRCGYSKKRGYFYFSWHKNTEVEEYF